MPSADWDFLWSIYVSNLKFLTLFVMKLRMAMQNEENGVVQGHQGSLKVISNIVAHSTESTQLPFFSINRNYASVLYYSRNSELFVKNQKSSIFTYPTRILVLQLRETLFEFHQHVWALENQNPWGTMLHC